MRRYPELQNIGLVKLVPASQLRNFERFLDAHPVRPLGPHSVAPEEGFQVLPAGRRPYYCFAVAGLARSTATYIPGGADYCALAPVADHRHETRAKPATRRSSTAPRPRSGSRRRCTAAGRSRATVAQRRERFVGWLGELLLPDVVLARALEGHPNVAIRFRYHSGTSNVSFSIGKAPSGAQVSTSNLHNGWTVQTLTVPVRSGIVSNNHSLTLLIGGTLLSVLFGLLVISLGTGRRRAMALVMEKTRELSHQALHDSLTGLPEPGAGARPRRTAAGAGVAQSRYLRGRPVHRHRRLQARQRQPRTRSRRPAAEGGRGTAAEHGSRRRYGRTARRRRVRGAGLLRRG